MQAMKDHIQDEMLAGFGALCMVHDEGAEDSGSLTPVSIRFPPPILADQVPTRDSLPGNQT